MKSFGSRKFPANISVQVILSSSIDATAEDGTLGRLLNHSRSGNCKTKVHVIKDKPHLIFVMTQDVKAGEELTYDYGDRSKDALESHPWLKY